MADAAHDPWTLTAPRDDVAASAGDSWWSVEAGPAVTGAGASLLAPPIVVGAARRWREVAHGAG